MKTRELAKALTDLASLLRSLPDMEFGLFLTELRAGHFEVPHAQSKDTVTVNVATLAALSRVNKAQWKELIEQWGLPISVPRKDSARNIMGEVMRYLTDHPAEIQRLQQQVDKTSRASPALMKALSILMADSTNEEPQPGS